MKAWVGCLCGGVIGIGGLLGWQRLRGPAPELLAARHQIEELARERAEAVEEAGELRQRLLAMGMVNDDLGRRLNDAAPSARPEAPPLATVPPPLPTPPPVDEAMIRAARTRFLRDEADKWKRRLLLTESQAEQVDRALAEDLRSSETSSWRDPSKVSAFQRELERVLTPEQKTKYESIQQKEKQESAELNARLELSQVEQAVEITEAQRQAILKKLIAHNPIFEPPPPVASAGSSEPPNPLAYMRAQMDRRVEALDGILTPVQLEEYRDRIAAQLEQMETMMKSSASTRRSER